MKILAVHNRYLIRGGEDECFDSEVALLLEKGHEVFPYIQSNEDIDKSLAIQSGLRAIWSRSDYKNIRCLVRKHKPQIVHVQNFFPRISPSVYYAAKAEKVPVIQNLNNYRLLCLNSYFSRNNSVCEKCLPQTFPISGVVHGCYRNNHLASSAVAAMITFHRTIRTWERMVDAYIALTDFSKNKYIQGGLPEEKIMIKPNFVYPDPGHEVKKQDFVLFVGRLSEEKGIQMLISTWRSMESSLALKIIGDGPLQSLVQSAAEEIDTVEYLGRQSVENTCRVMGAARALVFPSNWFEGQPRVIIEAFAKGTPVIATNIGSMQNLIQHQKTGLHFTAGSQQDLKEKLRWMMVNPLKWEKIRKFARLEFETKYTAEISYNCLMKIYQEVTDNYLLPRQA